MAFGPLATTGCYLEIMSNGPLPGFANAASAAASILPSTLSPALSRAAAAVVPALSAAAQRTGVDFGALFHTARLESGFNPAARAKTSSATGLFQFIDSTWLGMLNRHGAALGLAGLPKAQALALRKDPAVSSLMAAEHMAENAKTLQAGLGRPAGQTDLYLAHFLGVGGALRFLRTMASDPQATGAAVFPSAARANRAIFYAGGAPRSLEQIHHLLGERMAGQPVDRNPLLQMSGPGADLSQTGPLSAVIAQLQPAPDRPGMAVGRADQAPIAPADAARLAYLMLADLGG